jgi:NADH-quinone oxidoreductase subunit M
MSPITLIILLPAIGALIVVFLKAENKTAIKLTSVIAAGLTVVLALYMMVNYDTELAMAEHETPAAAAGVTPDALDPGSPEKLARVENFTKRFQFTEKFDWVTLPNNEDAAGQSKALISWHVGADGISVVMLLLTACVIFAGTLVSWSIQDRTKEFYTCLLALVAGVFGVFGTRDVFWFYFFYELAVIPMYLLIATWGSGNKEYAAMKLTLYLSLGAVVALVGLLAMVHATKQALGFYSFDMGDMLLAAQQCAAGQAWGSTFQYWVFPLILLGFGAIAPMWPLHTWSPIGHAAAPSAASMLHAGVLMKLGGYGILRIGMTLLPVGAHEWLPWVAILCCFNVVYGGMVAMAQKDMKFIIGFSSSSHMGYVLLGLACVNYLGVNGAVFLMFAHGIMTALAFGLIGFFYDQTHTRMLPDLGGLSKQIPFVGMCFTMMALASLGLPGFANFASEVMIFFAAWERGITPLMGGHLGGTRYLVAAVLGVLGIVITATYLLRAVRSAFFGPRIEKWDKVTDANTWFKKLPFVFLILVLVFFGCFPSLLTEIIRTGVEPIVDQIRDAAAATGG